MALNQHPLLLKLKSIPLKFYLLACILFIAGIVFWGGFNWAMEATNNETFCISCHEMRNNVYAEYQETIHYSNNSGVRATCPDCHVPKTWQHKLIRKVRASNELWHTLIGSIDTAEKFEKKRIELASHVWETMESTDSRECRNCHEFDHMTISKQKDGARLSHLEAEQTNTTCITCHKGIAHQLPEEFFDVEHANYRLEGRECKSCHANLRYDALWDEE